MGTSELKSNLHRLLEGIEDQHLLQALYDFLKGSPDTKEGEIWKTLSESERKRVLEAYDESGDDKKLTDWEILTKKH